MYITPKQDLIEWIENNIDDALKDSLSDVAKPYTKENKWDDVEVDFMIDEMTEKIKQGILNVVETYEEV